MARIRTVKPELFRHETLYELEKETGLPLRLAFIGLFTSADREGAFKWRPRELKLDVMPYDNVDFSRVLDALITRGFVLKYLYEGTWYGLIPGFARHQVINNRESASVFPSIDMAEQVIDEHSFVLQGVVSAIPRVEHASVTPLVQGQGEGKGREGKRKGREDIPTRQPLFGFELPEWINQDSWNGFIDMRKKIKAPMTEKAMSLAISNLDKLRSAGNEPNAVLDQSTMNSWKGLFELKAGTSMKPNNHHGFDDRDYFEGLTDNGDGTHGF